MTISSLSGLLHVTTRKSGFKMIASGPGGLLCTISAQFFAEHQVTARSHPSYRHEEPASPNTWIRLLTGGLLVRVQPEEPFPHQQLTVISVMTLGREVRL